MTTFLNRTLMASSGKHDGLGPQNLGFLPTLRLSYRT